MAAGAGGQMTKVEGRRSRWRWWALGMVAAAVVVAVVARSRGGGPEPQKKPLLRTAKAEVADVQVRVTEVGTVEPQVKVDVKAVLSGKVVELLVREGDHVGRGQVLARVEPDVNQARDLAQVKNSVHEAEIALNEARENYERDHRLSVEGLLSARSHLESETRFKTAKALHDAAVEKYRIVEESGVPIALAEAGTTQRLNVTSPMDGVVIRRSVELGDTVMSGVSSISGGTVLVTVADVGTMIIEAGINEVDIGKIRLQQPVKVTLDAYPKVRFSGLIQRIAPAARLEDKVKVFDVEISVDRQGAELRTGMTANVDVLGERREKVLTVPIEALYRRDEEEIVYVRKTGTPASPPPDVEEKDRWKWEFEVREVETGLASVDKVEIVSGLKAGDEVAVEDPTKPRERKDRE